MSVIRELRLALGFRDATPNAKPTPNTKQPRAKGAAPSPNPLGTQPERKLTADCRGQNCPLGGCGSVGYSLPLDEDSTNGASDLEEVRVYKTSEDSSIFVQNCGVAAAGDQVVRIVSSDTITLELHDLSQPAAGTRASSRIHRVYPSEQHDE